MEQMNTVVDLDTLSFDLVVYCLNYFELIGFFGSFISGVFLKMVTKSGKAYKCQNSQASVDHSNTSDVSSSNIDQEAQDIH